MRSGTPGALGAVLALSLQGGVMAAPPPSAAGPSFDCARATAQVNRLICATPSLGAADRRLAEAFDAIVHQGGVDGAALRADEARWLRDVRNACADARCLARVYADREAALREKSARAASPAAYDETRPLPAPAAILAQAKSTVGASCATRPGGDPLAAFPGFTRIAGFLPVNFNGGYVQPLQRSGVRFAFLLSAPGADMTRCRVADVVVLPPPRPREAFLQCRLDVAQSYGVGLRQDGRPAVVGYWTIDSAQKALRREPLGVLGGASQVRCQEPETGE